MGIPNDTWVVITDGEKFLLLKNEGDEEYINLRIFRHERIHNPMTGEQATDAPVGFDDAGYGKSDVEQTDWHEMEKARFAQDLAERLKSWALNRRFDRIIVVADPHTLGIMRPQYHAEVRKRIYREVSKDLTNHPLPDIEKILQAI